MMNSMSVRPRSRADHCEMSGYGISRVELRSAMNWNRLENSKPKQDMKIHQDLFS